MHKVVNNQMSMTMENFPTTSALSKLITAIFFIVFNVLVVWSVELTYNFVIISLV